VSGFPHHEAGRDHDVEASSWVGRQVNYQRFHDIALGDVVPLGGTCRRYDFSPNQFFLDPVAVRVELVRPCQELRSGDNGWIILARPPSPC